MEVQHVDVAGLPGGLVVSELSLPQGVVGQRDGDRGGGPRQGLHIKGGRTGQHVLGPHHPGDDETSRGKANCHAEVESHVFHLTRLQKKSR